MRTWKVDVTFEFVTRPPLTAKGLVIAAGSVATAASRAVRQAQRQLKPRGVASMVVLAQQAETEPVGRVE